MNYILYLGYAALVVFFVYRQLATGPVTGRSLVLMPALLAYGTIQTLGHSPLGTTPLSVGFLTVNSLLGIGFGLWRGQTFAVWSEGATILRRGTWMTLWNWLALLGSRLILASAAVLAGVGPGSMTGDLLVSLFLTFAAQNVVIWMRAEAVSGRSLPVETRVR
jgi:hypothetical protein